MTARIVSARWPWRCVPNCEVLITASCLPENDTFYTDLADEGWSVVGMDRGLTPERFASVVSNDQKAAYALTRSVMDGSTRRIAWLNAMPELSVSRERRAGFFAALEGTGVEAVTFSGGRYERDVGVELAQQLFAAGDGRCAGHGLLRADGRCV